MSSLEFREQCSFSLATSFIRMDFFIPVIPSLPYTGIITRLPVFQPIVQFSATNVYDFIIVFKFINSKDSRYMMQVI